MKKQIISTAGAPKAIGPYVQGIDTGSLLFLSGQLGMDVDGNLPENAEKQAYLSMKNIGEILRAAGLDYSDIVKCTIFIKDMNDFQLVNEVYKSYFNQSYPARSCVEVSRLPKNALVEIEAVAMR